MLKNYHTIIASANVAATSANVSLYVWGDNSGGQLGIGTTINKSTPTAISNFLNGRSFAQLVAGTSHSLAIDTLGGLWTWGKNNIGQLGDGTTIDKISPVKIGSSSWGGVGTAGNTSIAVSTTGTLFAWGDNSGYQVGDGTTINRSSPVQISTGYYNAPAYNSWVAISTRLEVSNSMAIRADRTLWSWGTNNVGQRGDSTTVSRSSPVQIGNSSWSTIAVTESTCAAIDINGRLFTWGLGTSGQLGDGTAANKSSPVQIGTSSWSKVSIGTHALAIASNGTLWAWGLGTSGQLGDGTTITKSSPVQIGAGSWTAVAAGILTGAFSAAIDITGKLFAWGLGTVGQIGDGTTISKSSPVQIGTGISFTIVTVGGTYAVAISTTGALYLWGLGTSGQLGDGTTINKSTPLKIGASSWTAVAAGTVTTFAIDINNILYSWGTQSITATYLGDPSGLPRSSPVAVTLPSTTVNSWKSVASTISNTVAIRATDSTLWSWGLNDNGQLGDGTTLPYYVPKQIGSRTWGKLGRTQGASHIVAIDSVGGLWAWGFNNNGQLGDNTVVSKSSPVQIGASSWSMVACSNNYTVAIDINGALYAWGLNTSGQTGDGTTITKSSPVKIGASSWSMVSANEDGTVGAIDILGRLFFWGATADGNGDGTTINKSSPVQIGASSWTFVGFGGFNSLAIDITGRLFIWGNLGTGAQGYYGASATTQSSPVQIGVGTSFVSVSMGRTHAVALDTTQKLWSWGAIPQPVGQGGISYAIVPAQVGNSSWSVASAGTDTTFAIDSTGKLYAWGKNDNGLLGVNTYSGVGTYKSLMSPVVTVTANATPSIISAGAAIDSLGSLWTWGSNSGDGISDIKFRPVKIPSASLVAGDTSFSNILSSGFGTYTLAVGGSTTTPNIYAWGTNLTNSANFPSGGIGTPSTPYFAQPTQVEYNNLDIAENPATRTTIFIANDTWNKISISQSSAMAIRGDGSLWAWGLASSGNLGYGGVTLITHPVQIGTSSWTAVAAAISSTAAIDINGRLYGWGAPPGNGSNTSDSRLYPSQIGTSSWIAVYATSLTHYAIDVNRRLFAWGTNTNGQIGDGTTINRSSPVQIGINSWTVLGGVHGGPLGTHQIAIATDGTLWAWGLNSSGQLGDGTTANQSNPVQIGTSSWIAVAAGFNHTLAIDINGRLFSWGNNTQSQLGDGTTVSRSSPVQVGSSSWTAVWAGYSYSHGKTIDGTLYAWGVNLAYQLGFGNQIDARSPPMVVSQPNGQYAQIVAGYTNTVAITTDGKAYAVGFQSLVANFDGSGNNKQLFQQIGTLNAYPGKNIKKILTTSTGATLIQDQGGRAWTAGNNTSGELSLSSTIGRVTPSYNNSSYNVAKIAVAPASFFAIAQVVDNTGYYLPYTILNLLQAWGYNENGDLGNAENYNRSLATIVPLASVSSTKSWRTIVSSYFGSLPLAIDSNNMLWAWGSGSNGGLGTGSYTSILQTSPIQIGNSSWSAVYANYGQVMAIRADGALFAWGTGGNGLLGPNAGGPNELGNNYTVNSPVQVPSSATVAPNNSWKAVSVSTSWAMAIASDGTLWGWGLNSNGQLGLSSTVTRPILFQAGTSSWTMVSVGGPTINMAAGITIDGGLWTWGAGNNGPIGDGTTVSKSTPTKIGTSSWSLVSAGDGYVAAIDILGRLFTWGLNTSGQLGSLTVVNRSSPVQIGTGISFTTVSAGTSSVGAIDSTGLLYFWGSGGSGQLGDGTTITKSSPVQIGTSLWTAVAAPRQNATTSAAIRTNGALFAWGGNATGTIGDGTTINKSSPVQIGASSWTAVNIAGNFGNTYAIDINGRFFVWGNGTGGVPDGIGNSTSSPVQIGTSSWTAVNAGYFRGQGIKVDGTFWGWGVYGAPIIYATNFFSPVQIGSSYTLSYGQSWSMVSIGQTHVHAIDSTGALYAWGRNDGTGTVFGDSTMTNTMSLNIQQVPYKITGTIGASSWISVAASDSMASAVDSNYIRYAWGSNINNQFGILGLTTGNYITPQGGVDSNFSFKQLGAGQFHMWGLSTNGTLYTWGTNTVGQLGDGTTIIRSSPTQIGTSSWSAVAASSTHMVAITASGALYSWGGATNGRLGDGTTLNKSSPVQIGYTNYGQFGLTTSWQAVGVLVNETFAINQQSKKLYGAGQNLATLATGDFLQRAGLTELVTTPTTGSVVDIASGLSHGVAVFNDGTSNLLYTWGHNNAGQLGDGTTLNNIISTKITDYKYFKNIIVGGNHTFKQ